MQRWWERQGDDVAAATFGIVNSIENEVSYREDELALFSSLYMGRDIGGLDPDEYDAATVIDPETLTYNIVRSMCDTVKSKVTKEKPTAKFLTTDGDWTDIRTAKKLNRFCEAMMANLRVHEHSAQAFLDCTIWGTGILKVYRDRHRIRLERVLPLFS